MVVNWLLLMTQGLGYGGIVILMAIESSFLPLPSEVIIPPAAYLASQGKMSLALIIVVGTLGSVLGATINYLLSMSLGRLVVYKLAGTRWAKCLFIIPEKLAGADQYCLAHSKSATFFSRLIPVIRHLISIPAGFSRMPFGSFIFYTAAGAAVWVSILATLGYFVGANHDLIEQYYSQISWGLLILFLLWLAWRIRKWRITKI